MVLDDSVSKLVYGLINTELCSSLLTCSEIGGVHFYCMGESLRKILHKTLKASLKKDSLLFQ